VATVGVFPGVTGADDAAPPIRALLDDPGQLAAWLRERDPMFESARAKVEAATQLDYQTHVLPNPQLQVTAGGFVLGPTNTNNGGSGSDIPHLTLAETTNFTFGISELVELGKRGPRQTAAGLRAQEAGETAVASLGGRLGDATNALGHLAYVAAKRETLAANAEAARRLADSEKVRLDKKDLSAAEYARIELDAEQVERALARGEADLAGAIAVCSATLYARCAPAGLDSAALDAAAPLPAQLPASNEAIERRPVREASRLEARALGWDATLAQRRRIPDPTLSVSYMIDNLVQAGNQHQQAIFSVGIPLPAFDRGDHDAAAARANARAIEAEDIATIRGQYGLVQALLAQRDTLQKTLATLERDALPKSTQIVTQTRHAFDLGEARLADLLLVERAHRDLLLEVLDTRYDLFNVRAQLRQALGLDDQVARAAGGRTR
jgi:cobalt-zinc-cadmium efflux system outer membrane protein